MEDTSVTSGDSRSEDTAPNPSPTQSENFQNSGESSNKTIKQRIEECAECLNQSYSETNTADGDQELAEKLRDLLTHLLLLLNDKACGNPFLECEETVRRYIEKYIPFATSYLECLTFEWEMLSVNNENEIDKTKVNFYKHFADNVKVFCLIVAFASVKYPNSDLYDDPLIKESVLVLNRIGSLEYKSKEKEKLWTIENIIRKLQKRWTYSNICSEEDIEAGIKLGQRRAAILGDLLLQWMTLSKEKLLKRRNQIEILKGLVDFESSREKTQTDNDKLNLIYALVRFVKSFEADKESFDSWVTSVLARDRILRQMMEAVNSKDFEDGTKPVMGILRNSEVGIMNEHTFYSERDLAITILRIRKYLGTSKQYRQESHQTMCCYRSKGSPNGEGVIGATLGGMRWCYHPVDNALWVQSVCPDTEDDDESHVKRVELMANYHRHESNGSKSSDLLPRQKELELPMLIHDLRDSLKHQSGSDHLLWQVCETNPEKVCCELWTFYHKKMVSTRTDLIGRLRTLSIAETVSGLADLTRIGEYYTIWKKVRSFYEELTGRSAAVDQIEDPKGIINTAPMVRGLASLEFSNEEDRLWRAQGLLFFLIPEIVYDQPIAKEKVDIVKKFVQDLLRQCQASLANVYSFLNDMLGVSPFITNEVIGGLVPPIITAVGVG